MTNGKREVAEAINQNLPLKVGIRPLAGYRYGRIPLQEIAGGQQE
jgi:hypothetical protein